MGQRVNLVSLVSRISEPPGLLTYACTKVSKMATIHVVNMQQFVTSVLAADKDPCNHCNLTDIIGYDRLTFS